MPVVSGSGLEVVTAATANQPGRTVLPPTEAGWQAFLAQAPSSGLTFTELANAGKWWWGRNVPRNLLSGGAGDGDDEVEGAA
jgi:hypothetical protein